MSDEDIKLVQICRMFMNTFIINNPYNIMKQDSGNQMIDVHDRENVWYITASELNNPVSTKYASWYRYQIVIVKGIFNGNGVTF